MQRSRRRARVSQGTLLHALASVAWLNWFPVAICWSLVCGAVVRRRDYVPWLVHTCNVLSILVACGADGLKGYIPNSVDISRVAAHEIGHNVGKLLQQHCYLCGGDDAAVRLCCCFAVLLIVWSSSVRVHLQVLHMTMGLGRSVSQAPSGL